MAVYIDLDAEYEPDRAFRTSWDYILCFQTLVTAYLESGRRGARFPLLMRDSSGPEARYEVAEQPELLAELTAVRVSFERLWVPAIEVVCGDDIFVDLIRMSRENEPEAIFDLGDWRLGVDTEGLLFVDLLGEPRRIRTTALLPEPPGYRTEEGEVLPIAPPSHPQLPERWFTYRSTSSPAGDHFADLLDGMTRLTELASARGVPLRIA
jgi:hypothetical protein